MSENSVIDRFRGKFFFLSNFFEAEITYNGLTYKNNEAAFQAQKCLSERQKLPFTEYDPGMAKRRGRHVQLRGDWERVKFGIMEEIVRAKFLQNPELAERLIETGNSRLVEGNDWGDTTWGFDIRRKRGENHLGKILMKIRSELIESRKSKTK